MACFFFFLWDLVFMSMLGACLDLVLHQFLMLPDRRLEAGTLEMKLCLLNFRFFSTDLQYFSYCSVMGCGIQLIVICYCKHNGQALDDFIYLSVEYISLVWAGLSGSLPYLNLAVMCRTVS